MNNEFYLAKGDGFV